MNPNALIDVAPELIPDTTPAIEDVVAVARLKGEPLLHFPDDLYIPPDALKLFLESFEGPFDLLLYLIRKQRLDLNEISVAAVTDQYMQYVEQIRAQNMELASDYLVMAADLMMIKSRLLLPVPVSEDSDEEEDPTARILREVAEYEKIQVAAQLLNALPTMGDGFWRGFVAVDEEEPQLLKASKNPYEFTVNAGHHTVVTLDPKKEGKQSNWKLVGGFMGATFGMANGNIYTTMMGGESGSNFVSDMISAGASTMEFDLAEGDVIKIQCKATLTGKVTMKTV